MVRNGYVETVFGRRRRFPNYRTAEKADRARQEREAVNMIIQSTASDIVKMAEVRCMEQCPQAIQWAQIHDEIKFEVPAPAARSYITKLKEIMEEPVAPFDILFPVDGGIEERWGVPYEGA